MAKKFKQFRKGQIVKGEMKHANNKPAFLLVDGCCVVPLTSIREVVTKEVTSDVTGDAAQTPIVKNKIDVKVSKLKIMDAGIIGGLVGLGGVWLAHKQSWLPVVDNKNYLYGAVIGAAAGMYLLYRFKPKHPVTEKKD